MAYRKNQVTVIILKDELGKVNLTLLNILIST